VSFVVESVDTWTTESVTQELLADAQRHIDNLKQALRTSRQIGMALGILMCRHGWTEHRAFAALREASQHQHRKLRDVARDVVVTGELRTTHG
jgi:AmiR/NasT family two-component response regulator